MQRPQPPSFPMNKRLLPTLKRLLSVDFDPGPLFSTAAAQGPTSHPPSTAAAPSGGGLTSALNSVVHDDDHLDRAAVHMSKNTLVLGRALDASSYRPVQRRVFRPVPSIVTLEAVVSSLAVGDPTIGSPPLALHPIGGGGGFPCPHGCLQSRRNSDDDNLQPLSYTHKASLRHHIKSIHSRLRDLACSDCIRRFTSKSLLKRHMRTHTNEKPYGCNECTRRYPVGAQLTVHKLTKHNATGLPFACLLGGCLHRALTKKAHHLHVHQVHPESPNFL